MKFLTKTRNIFLLDSLGALLTSILLYFIGLSLILIGKAGSLGVARGVGVECLFRDRPCV